MWKQVIKFFGDENTKTLKSFQKQADKINELEPAMQALKNEDFPVKTEEFKKRIQDGESMDELIPETFALVREASKRVLENVILTCSCWEDLHCIMVISLKWQQVKEKLYPQLVLFFSTLYQEMACI